MAIYMHITLLCHKNSVRLEILDINDSKQTINKSTKSSLNPQKIQHNIGLSSFNMPASTEILL